MTKTGIAGFLFLGLLVFIWGANALNTHRVRYRITVETDTPQGVRSGSSVVEVLSVIPRFIPIPSNSAINQYVRGEAAFVDLGEGRQVIALLASGPRAEDSDWPIYVWQAFGNQRIEDVWDKLSPARAALALPPQWLPTLVTFTDIADPASARVVAPTPQGFEASFGAGYALRAITLRYVDPGLRITHIWPFNRWDGGWPQWLFGEPVTRGIEQRLPWWNGPFPWLKQLGPGSTTYVDTRPNDQYRMNKEQFRRSF
jgi:hypothetical protein